MAAKLISKPTPIHKVQHKRFTKKHHGYHLDDLSLSSSGNIAVCGWNNNTKRTFVDLYSRDNFDSGDKLTLFYSKDFDKCSDYLGKFVSFLEIDGSAIALVSCTGDVIEIIDTKRDRKVLRSCRVRKWTTCLAVREGEIFIGLGGSQTVIVFNNDLKETNNINLKGIKDDDYLNDLQVINDKLFVCTSSGRALAVGMYDGSIITEYKDTTGKNSKAFSITASGRMGLIAVLWVCNDMREIICYSLNGDKSFLVFDVGSHVLRIRISHRDRMVITGNRRTGEIKMFDMEQLFSFEGMKNTLGYIVLPDEFKELRKYFGVTDEEIIIRMKSHIRQSEDKNSYFDESNFCSDEGQKHRENLAKKMQFLFVIMREKEHLDPWNVSYLKDAVSSLGDEMRASPLEGPIEGYSLHGVPAHHKTIYEDLGTEVKTMQHAWQDERRQLTGKLEAICNRIYEMTEEHQRVTEAFHDELGRMKKKYSDQEMTLMEKVKNAEQKLKEERAAADEEIGSLTEELEQTKQSLDLSYMESTKEIALLNKELEQARTQSSKVIKTLLEQLEQKNEKLNQTKEAMAELQKKTLEDESSIDSKETKCDVQILAAEFRRLNVAIAENLTLDHCLKLAKLFDIPASDSETLRRVSLKKSPGMKLLDVLKKQKVINMFDVTNLQKGLAMLHLETLNNDLVTHYQKNIDDDQYKLQKAGEMFTSQEVKAFANTVKIDTTRSWMGHSQLSPEDYTEPDSSFQERARVMSKYSRTLSRDRHHELYIEENIDEKGGTLHLANVSLTIPPEALQESFVIALTIMNESPFPLNREVDSARMTPLIKLEPLGLKFRKLLKLNIPHSAIIPEPENHDVIIYAGKITNNSGDSLDCIQWTVDTSVQRTLREKSVTIDIECLSYLSASLVSQNNAPPTYIVRTVPFVNGVRNAEDDIILTVCFCSDNDLEYDMLLSDYQTKLPLDEFSTLHLRRHSEKDEDQAGFLNVTITSENNNYLPDNEQAVKNFAVSHLCTASRVSHQLRLKRNQESERDIVDIVLTFSQANYTPSKVFLKARIKDLIVSEESEDLLAGFLSQDLKPYEDLKANISSILQKHHCRNLATYFELSPAERDRVENNSAPGEMLMTILDEREKIMPQKMIGLFQGLKSCHLDKIARLVSDYIDKNSEQAHLRQQYKGETTAEIFEPVSASQSPSTKHQIRVGSPQSDQSLQTTLFSSSASSNVHVRTLNEVLEALDIVKNRLSLTKRGIQYHDGQRASTSLKDTFLFKEQYFDEKGGELTLREANVVMLIPAGAFSRGSIVNITMMTNEHVSLPLEGRIIQLSPIIKCGQESLNLNKAVTLRIPHCAVETKGITATEVYFGYSTEGGEIKWRKRKRQEPKPTFEKDYFEVSVQKFCTISLEVAVEDKKYLAKRLRVLPLISRIANPTDDLNVTLWIYNDDETEHMYLLHDEITTRGKIQLHEYKVCTLKGSERDKEVHMKSVDYKITPYSNTTMKKLLSTTLWQNTRHSVDFQFQNEKGVGDISFRIRLYKKQFLRTIEDIQFELKVTLSELMQKPHVSTRSPFKINKPQPAMEKSFQELVRKLSGKLSLDSCLEIAGMFGLPADFRDEMKKSSEVGPVLFKELVQEQLISACNVSALDVTLTRTGNEDLAREVKEYRMRNVTFPTTTFTLL